MNLFMATLENEARSWYESFPPSCTYCLKYCHTIFFERQKESCPSLILVQNCCKHVNSFIENLENFYGDDEFMDDEIMEALYENPFQQHREILEDTYQDQQAEDICTFENDGRQGLISDMIGIKNDMWGKEVPTSNCDEAKLANPDLDLKCDDEQYVVPDPMKRFLVLRSPKIKKKKFQT